MSRFLFTAALLALSACSDPNLLSESEIRNCRASLEAGFAAIMKDEGSQEEVRKEVLSSAEAGKLSDAQKEVLLDEVRGFPEQFAQARRHKSWMDRQLERASEGPVEGIRAQYEESGWCEGRTQFYSPARSVRYSIENPDSLGYQVRKYNEERRKKEAREEARRNSEELDRINDIKEQLRQKAISVSSATDAYGAVAQIYSMPDGKVLTCKTDFTGGEPLFWCEGGYDRYVR